MEIFYEEEQAQVKLSDDLLELFKKAAEIALDLEDNIALEDERAQISLSFVLPEDIKELNRDYRGIDRVTDVLSFPQYEDIDDIPEEGEICLGDVVICVERAKEQAEEYGHSLQRELVYLFTHSVLHLLGYDHMEESEKAVMRKREEEIMSALGLTR